MTRLDPERWRVLSPYIDEALALSEERRREWIADLRSRDTALAADVEALFEVRSLASREAFLEGPPPLSTAGDSLAQNRDHHERAVIQRALMSSGYSRARAASSLGISRVTLYKKMKKHGLMETPGYPASTE